MDSWDPANCNASKSSLLRSLTLSFQNLVLYSNSEDGRSLIHELKVPPFSCEAHCEACKLIFLVLPYVQIFSMNFMMKTIVLSLCCKHFFKCINQTSSKFMLNVFLGYWIEWWWFDKSRGHLWSRSGCTVGILEEQSHRGNNNHHIASLFAILFHFYIP